MAQRKRFAPSPVFKVDPEHGRFAFCETLWIVARNSVAPTKNRNLRNLKSVARRAADGLGAAEVAALVARAARSARAAVADALSSKRVGKALVDESATIAGAEMRLIDVEEANLPISSRTRTGRKEELIALDELAARAGLKIRRSVHD